MTTEPDSEFFRNYFASYEMEPSGLEEPVKLEYELEDCACVMNCYIRFSPEVRLQLRGWYQRLTPQGRTAFLSSHMREPSPGHNLYRLPTGTGDLGRVCMAHFMNTLGETRDRIRVVILGKRNTFVPEQEEQIKDSLMELDEEDGGEDFLPDRRYRKGTKGAAMLDRVARGQSYRTVRTKRIVAARTVKAPCDSTCWYKCYERFTLEDRQGKLKELLQMPLAKQREFLTDLACKLAPVRKRAPSNVTSRMTVYYFFREGRKLHRVCRTMFLNTYDITDRRFRTLMEGKGADAHVICGNPKLERVLKKYQHKRLIFYVDEGLDEEVDRKALLEFLHSRDRVSEDETELEDEHDEISIDCGTIKPELDDAEQEILPDRSPAINNEISVCNGVVEPSTVWIKQESMDCDEPPTQYIKRPSVDIKTECVELDEKLVVPLTRCDDQIDEDSNCEPDEDDSYSDCATSSRVVKPHCGTKCNMQCYTRVSDELRQQLLADVLRMSSSKQQKFIGDHICVTPSSRLRSRLSKRRFSNFYFLPVDSRLVKVCRQMFCSTYGLTFRQMRDIILKKGADKHMVCGNPNFPFVLKRGAGYYYDYDAGKEAAEEECKCNLHCSRKISKEVIESIRNSFHKKVSDEQYNFLSKFVRLPVGDKQLLFRARFFLPLEDRSEQVEEVCRKMFLAAFKVPWSFVRVLLDELESTNVANEHAKSHIAFYRMDVDHHCGEAEGIDSVRKLSHCPNPVRMYNEYLEGLASPQEQQQQQGRPKVIDYKQYFRKFIKYYTNTGLELPTKCPDCGFFSSGEDVS